MTFINSFVVGCGRDVAKVGDVSVRKLNNKKVDGFNKVRKHAGPLSEIRWKERQHPPSLTTFPASANMARRAEFPSYSEVKSKIGVSAIDETTSVIVKAAESNGTYYFKVYSSLCGTTTLDSMFTVQQGCFLVEVDANKEPGAEDNVAVRLIAGTGNIVLGDRAAWAMTSLAIDHLLELNKGERELSSGTELVQFRG